MAEISFIAAMGLGLLALLMAFRVAPVWQMKARIHARMRRQRAVMERDTEDSPVSEALIWLAGQSLFRADYQELEPSLRAPGRKADKAIGIYLAWCWLFPVLVGVVALGWLDFVSAALTLLASFYLPRRLIRAAGKEAEQQQNREAIDLCHMTRMLMEAGLSPERAMKLVSTQARALMPHLIHRVDRFNRVMESGADRTQAFEEMAANKHLVVLRSYAALMKQSGNLGSRVATGLDQIIQEAQNDARSRLKEDTNKVGARMTIIMMLFMLPSLFMLIGGPAVLSILDAF